MKKLGAELKRHALTAISYMLPLSQDISLTQSLTDLVLHLVS